MLPWATIQLVAGVILFISLAYLSANYFKVWDLTKDKDFTLSDRSQKILRQPALQDLGHPIRLTALFRKDSPHFQRLRRTVNEYIRESKGLLDATFIDPIREPDAAARIVDTHGFTLNTDVLILDARPPGEEAPNPALTKFIPLQDFIIFRTDTANQRRPVGYQIEDRISTALLSIAEGNPRKLYFIADKSPLDDAGPDSPWAVLTDTLRRQNLLLQPLRISETDTIPADAEAVVLVAPSYDFEERELAVLEDYWQRPGSAFLAFLDPAHRPLRLRAFLRRHGVTPNDDRILSVKNGRTIRQVPATFTTFDGTNEGLFGQATTFEGATCSLTVRENAEDLNSNNIFPLILLEAAPAFWGETRFRETGTTPAFDSSEDLRSDSGLPLAAAVIVGDATSDEHAESASRMVVVSNSSFLHPDRLREEQLDFVQNSVNWLIGREQLVGIGPRGLRTYKLNLISPEVTFLNRLNLFILPGAFLFFGFLAWNARRA